MNLNRGTKKKKLITSAFCGQEPIGDKQISYSFGLLTFVHVPITNIF